MQLDWETKNYGFNSRQCLFSWRSIRMVALRSELEQNPEARAGDLLVTFPDEGNARDIIDHFRGYDNFRHGGVMGGVDGAGTVHVLLAPVV